MRQVSQPEPPVALSFPLRPPAFAFVVSTLQETRHISLHRAFFSSFLLCFCCCFFVFTLFLVPDDLLLESGATAAALLMNLCFVDDGQYLRFRILWSLIISRFHKMKLLTDVEDVLLRFKCVVQDEDVEVEAKARSC
jgi:hypothetical protein